MGVVSFADSARTVIGLTDDTSAILSAVSSIRRERGNTAIGAAIVRGQGLLEAKSMREGERARIMFLLTDGVNNRGPDPVTAADKARAAGTAVFAVGVGADVDANELEKIAGSKDRVLQVKDFDELRSIIFVLLQRACESPA